MLTFSQGVQEAVRPVHDGRNHLFSIKVIRYVSMCV